MKSIPRLVLHYLRRQLWALIVAYMLGLHNFYTGEDKTTDDITIRIEHQEAQENEGMKD